MKKHVTRQISFLRATAIGGVFFLLPFGVLCFFLGQLGQLVYVVAIQVQPYLAQYLGINDVAGYGLLLTIAVLLIILACFIAGILASRSIARQFTKFIEKYLLMMFPRYAIFKEQLSGNIGGDIAKNRLKPVCVQLAGYQSLGFEVERRGETPSDNQRQPDAAASSNTADYSGTAAQSDRPLTPGGFPPSDVHTPGEVTVYLPGSPDPWSGSIIVVRSEQVRSIDVPFGDVLGAFEKLGDDTQKLLHGESIH